ncbi:hypothetical protein H0H93_000470, partial [Arthromyces matolae]
GRSYMIRFMPVRYIYLKYLLRPSRLIVLQDLIDDIKAGNYSTAVFFGDHVKPILSIFAALFVSGFVIAGLLNGHGYLYYIITVGGSAVHLLWQLITLRPDVPADCWKKFKSNGDLGYIAFAGITADYLLK